MSPSAGLAEIRRGKSPTIPRGTYHGDELSVDHVIPFAVCPETENVISRIDALAPQWLPRDNGELIALFGNARLVKRLNGKFELLGGTDADRADAKEWCSLFLHESVISRVPTCRPHSF